MKELIIEKKAIRSNIAVLRKRAGQAAIYAVLTGDAHGAGLVEMAQFLRDEGIQRFAVSEVADAATLRQSGLIDEEILMLRATTDRQELEQLLDLNVVCTIGSADTGMALNGLAEVRSTVVEAQLLIDTGDGYGGFLPEEVDKILSIYRNLPNVAISGIYTNLNTTGVSAKAVTAQVDLFRQTVQAVEKAGFEAGLVHAAGSYAIMKYDFARLRAVRAGSLLMGRCQRTKNDGLTQVGRGEAAVDDIHWLPKDHTVGSENAVRLRRPTRVAILPIGYQNGFGIEHVRETSLFSLLKRARKIRNRYVYIGDQKVKIIGRIGALETVLDVTDVRCSEGDIASFDLDPQFARGIKRVWKE